MDFGHVRWVVSRRLCHAGRQWLLQRLPDQLLRGQGLGKDTLASFRQTTASPLGFSPEESRGGSP